MRKTGKSRVEEQARPQRYLPLKEFAREALWDTVIFSGLAYAEEALEEERRAICGERYAHLADRIAMRSGHVAPEKGWLRLEPGETRVARDGRFH